MQYPLNMRFKLVAVSPQIFVDDAAGNPVCYVKQKLFKLKEAVTVFRDSSKQQVLCDIKADRVIDWSASYHFYDPSGESFGSVRRKGMKSIWKAHYEVCDEAGTHEATISEDNPWAKVGDSIFGEIPLIGGLAGYVFHPKYSLTDTSGQKRLQMKKMPALWEGKYQIERMFDYDDVAELRGLMSFLMMALLERRRG